MLLTIISLLGSLLPVILPKLGTSASIDSLIEAAVAGIGSLFSSLKAGTPADDVVLATLTAALAALKADTSVDPVVLAEISEATADLEAAIPAYQAAQMTTDPSTLTPLPPVA
jgi:hypothetical protein